MCITGNNFQRNMKGYPYSYYFSKYNHCWGWASWRRAWQHYDGSMESYPEFKRAAVLDTMSSVPGFSAHWQKCFDSVDTRELDTWDYVWTYSCWAQNGLTATPRTNLVSNIGFRGECHAHHRPHKPLGTTDRRIARFSAASPAAVRAAPAI